VALLTAPRFSLGDLQIYVKRIDGLSGVSRLSVEELSNKGSLECKESFTYLREQLKAPGRSRTYTRLFPLTTVKSIGFSATKIRRFFSFTTNTNSSKGVIVRGNDSLSRSIGYLGHSLLLCGLQYIESAGLSI
jgi:hypothetical protein